MNLQMRCPSCNKLLQVAERLAGKKVRCTECDEIVLAPAKSSAAKTAVTSRPPARKPPKSDPDDDDRDDERSSSRSSSRSDGKRGKRKRKSSGAGLWIGLGAGGFGLVLIIVGLIVFLSSSAPRQEAPVNPPNFAGGMPMQAPVMAPVGAPMQQIVAAPPAGGPVPAAIESATVRRVKQATALLRVTTANGLRGEGSGFFALEQGLVITNAHVVGMMQSTSKPPINLEVIVNSGEPEERTFRGIVLGADPAHDLAVVSVTGGPLPPPLPIDTALSLTELQKVYIFGFPFGAQLGKAITVSDSSVSSLRKDPAGGIVQIQVNGGISPGNSGGPIVDARGVVVGVAVAIIQGTQINFAVPADFIQPLLNGRVQLTEVGAPYRAGDKVKMPVRVYCADPLRRIRGMHLDVWTGRTGTARLMGTQQPPPQAGDSPKTTIALTFRDGMGLADIDLPEAPIGGAVWLQPIILGDKVAKLWSACTPVVADGEAPLERVPVALQLNNDKQPQRTLDIRARRRVKVTQGQQNFDLGELTEVAMLELVRPTARGIDVHLHPSGVRLTRDVAGQPVAALPFGPQVAQRLLYTFLMGADGKLKERGQPGQLKTLNGAVRTEAETMFNSIANCYEATSFAAPQRKVQPAETWNVTQPLLLAAAGRTEVVDMKLVCSYEGRRLKEGAELAYVQISGNLVGRGQTNAGGRVTGHYLLDLAQGYISKAVLIIDSEFAAGAVLARSVSEIQIARTPGNPKNIAKVDPNAPLPAINAQGPMIPGGSPQITPIAKGKTLLAVKGMLAAADPSDPTKPGCHFKEHRVKLKAGVAYVIEMGSVDGNQLDPFLRLETDQGIALAEDDDGGGFPNARIVYTPSSDGEFRIIATTFMAAQTGAYSLSVAEVARGGKQP